MCISLIPNRSLEEQQSVVRVVIRWKRAVCEIDFLMAVIRKINLQNVCYQIVMTGTTEKGYPNDRFGLMEKGI